MYGIVFAPCFADGQIQPLVESPESSRPIPLSLLVVAGFDKMFSTVFVQIVPEDVI